MRLQAFVDLGWSPIFAVVNDGSRKVLQVTGWTGGTGTAPATGLYVGATGFVSLIANGVDISGPAATWGGITGTLSSQTDLQTALNAKQAILSLTTTGTSGVATLVGSTLNVPNYSAGSGINRSINVVGANTTAGSTANTDYVYIVTASAIITLPTAVSNTNRYTIKNASVVNISVAFTASQNADGSTSVVLTPNTALDFISDNTNYKIV